MRLYQSSKGQWFGTQADARRNAPRDWREVEVPTSKQELINWLSIHEVGAKDKGLASEPIESVVQEPKPELLSPHASSWVSWALERLQSGNKKDAVEMLKTGLRIQREIL